MTIHVNSLKGEIDYGTVFKEMEELISLKCCNSYEHNRVLVLYYIVSLKEVIKLLRELGLDNKRNSKYMIYNNLEIIFESLYNKNDEKIIYFNEIISYIVSGKMIIAHEFDGTKFWFIQYPVLSVLVLIYYIILCLKLR